jgi:hypothetical protein
MVATTCRSVAGPWLHIATLLASAWMMRAAEPGNVAGANCRKAL